MDRVDLAPLTQDLETQTCFYTLQGWALAGIGRKDDAMANFAKATSFAAGEWATRAHAGYAEALLEEQGPDVALRYLHNIQSRFPDDSRLWSLLLRASALAKLEVPQPPATICETVDVQDALAVCDMLAGRYQDAHRYWLDRARRTEAVMDRRRLLGVTVQWAWPYWPGSMQAALPADLRQAIEQTLEALGDLDALIHGLDDAGPRAETMCWLVVCLQLTGNETEARHIMTAYVARNRSPVTQAFFAYMLDRWGEYDKLERHFGNALEGQGDEVLQALAQGAANGGRLAFFNRIRDVLQLRTLAPDTMRDLNLFALLARQNAGQDLTEEDLTEVEGDAGNHLLFLSLALQQRIRAGDKDAASAYAECLVQSIDQNTPLHLRRATLALLDQCRQWRPMLSLLDAVWTDIETDAQLLLWRLRAYMSLGYRSRAVELIKGLSPEAQLSDQFRPHVIEAFRRVSDWKSLKELLEQHMANGSGRIGEYCLYVEVLRLRGDWEELRRFIARDVPIRDAAKMETQWAAMQISYGFPEQGFQRLYALARRTPEDRKLLEDIATIGLTRMVEAIAAPLPEVVAGSAVKLRFGEMEQWYILEADGGPATPIQWIGSTHRAYSRLLGKQVGEIVAWPARMLEVTAEVVAIHRCAFGVFSEALRMVKESRDPDANLQSMSGEPEQLLEKIKDSMRGQDAIRARSFAIYQEKGVPLAIMVKYCAGDLLDMVYGWPRDLAPFKVSDGTLEERAAAIRDLASADAWVLSLEAAIHLHAFGLLEQLAAGGRPLRMAQSAIDVIQNKIDMERWLRQDGRSMSLVLEGDELCKQEHSPEATGAFLTSLESLKATLQRLCRIEPALDPDPLPNGMSDLEEVLDPATFDTLLMALEPGALLICDDAHLRHRAKATLPGLSAAWSQVLLTNAISHNILKVSYLKFVTGMIRSGRSFMYWSSTELVTAAHLADGNDYAKRLPENQPLKTLLSPDVIQEAEFDSVVWEIGKAMHSLAVDYRRADLAGEVLDHFMRACASESSEVKAFILAMIWHVVRLLSIVHFLQQGANGFDVETTPTGHGFRMTTLKLTVGMRNARWDVLRWHNYAHRQFRDAMAVM